MVAGMSRWRLEEAVQQGPEGAGTHPVCGPQLQEDQAVPAAGAARPDTAQASPCGSSV